MRTCCVPLPLGSFVVVVTSFQHEVLDSVVVLDTILVMNYL